jgi:hypothetical protein
MCRRLQVLVMLGSKGLELPGLNADLLERFA